MLNTLSYITNFSPVEDICNKNKPKLIKIIKKDIKIYIQYRVSSYTFTSLNWLHFMWKIKKL